MVLISIEALIVFSNENLDTGIVIEYSRLKPIRTSKIG